MISLITLMGVAGSGKDTLCQLLIKKFNEKGIAAQRLALADALKTEISPLLEKEFSIDAFTGDPQEKDIIRPLLVAYGYAKRRVSKGKYFTDILQTKLDPNTVSIVTDIRYAEFDDDELHWAKRNNGVLVHIKKIIGYDLNTPIFQAPPNEHEKENDPKLQAAANYKVEWLSKELAGENHQEYMNNVATNLFNKIWKN